MSLLKNISDSELVDSICFENKSRKEIDYLLEKIQKAMTDDIFYHANKFAKRTSDFSEGWVYKTNTLIPVIVTDNVSEAYLWFSKYWRKKICDYSGKKNAKLKTFLNTVMSSPWARSNWLSFYYKRFTQHGITNKGEVGYIPVCIKKLSKKHQEIFLLLRKHKSEEKLVDETGLEIVQIESMIEDIRSKLIKSGKIDLIVNISTINFDESELYSSDEDKQVFSEVFELFNKYFNNLEKIDKELLKLKYYMDYTVKEIITFYKESDRTDELNDFGLSTQRHIYDYIEKISNSSMIAISGKKDINIKEAIQILTKKLFEEKYD